MADSSLISYSMYGCYGDKKLQIVERNGIHGGGCHHNTYKWHGVKGVLSLNQITHLQGHVLKICIVDLITFDNGIRISIQLALICVHLHVFFQRYYYVSMYNVMYKCMSFLPVGHTHEDIDQMFSRFSR